MSPRSPGTGLDESVFKKDEHEKMESWPFPGWIDP